MQYPMHPLTFFSALALLIMACSVQAEISVEDSWASQGVLTVRSEGWSLCAQKDTALLLEAGGETVRIAPAESTLTHCQVKLVDDQAQLAFRFTNENAFNAVIENTGLMTLSLKECAFPLILRTAIAVGLLPDRRMESVLYLPETHEAKQVAVPAEHWMAALLEGGNGILACAFEQAVTITLSHHDATEGKTFKEMSIPAEADNLYLQLLTAPALWHRESLGLDALEKGSATDWRRPVKAVYRTLLPLRGDSTATRTFSFLDAPKKTWKPETGALTYPVWFEEDQAHYFLSKKVPPVKDMVIFPYEGHELSLKGFLNRTPLEKMVNQSAPRIAIKGGPRAVKNVGYNACWGTFFLRRTVYAKGMQDREKDYLREHIDFITNQVFRIQHQNEVLHAFILKMRAQFLQWKEQEQDAGAQEYLKKMEECLDDLEEGYRKKMLLFGEDTPEAHRAHAERNRKRLHELLNSYSLENYPETCNLIGEINRMSWGHREDTGMRFCMLTHDWAQKAAYDCVACPQAIKYARQIRRLIRDALDNAPSY